MSGIRSKRSRMVGMAVGAAALASMAFGAGSAQAAPFTMDLNYGYADFGDLPGTRTCRCSTDLRRPP